MRNSTKIIILILLIYTLLPYPTLGQEFIGSVYQFSDGSSDYNPRFPVYTEGNFYYRYEYFVFERHIDSTTSKIFVRKINEDGPLGNEIELSDNSFKNVNPVIAYNNQNLGYELIPEYILVVWQTNKNGTEDIYGKFFINGSWSNEFAIDSSTQNSISPQIVCRDSSDFHIVYEKEGDIFYKEFNILSATLSSEINITSEDTTGCANPFVGTFGPYGNEDSLLIVSFERNVSQTNIPINYKILSNGIWSPSKVIVSSGICKNNGLIAFKTIYDASILSSYERKDSLNTNIYINRVLLSGGPDSLLITTNNQQGNYSSLAGGRSYFSQDGIYLSVFGFIEDNWFEKNALFYLDSPVSSEPDLKVYITPEFSFDTLEASLTASNRLSKQLPNASCRVYWFLFNRSETNQYQSRICGIQFRNCYYVNIDPISSEIPVAFALHQNYPNPFNPSTKIRFEIPGNEKQATLTVYNSLGQEVAVLFDEQLQPGVYEYSFDGSGYPSGVYFYRLEAGEFNETKRMVLVK